MTSTSSPCAKLKRCVCDTRLDGYVALVTGANAGIGYYTARELVLRGAHVILGCRSADRAQSAVKRIIQETGHDSVEYQLLDLASLQSVRNFAEEFSRKYPVLDLLVNNAGIGANPGLTEDGFEIHFQVNHLGHFLLTKLLLENLKRANQGRIVIVASEAYKLKIAISLVGRIPWDKFKKPIRPTFLAYSNSKLCNMLFTHELSKRVYGTSVTVNCLHPGVVATEIGRETFLMQWIIKIGKKSPISYLKSAEEGAQTTIHLCVCRNLSQVSGKYFSDCAEARTCMKARNDIDALNLWQVSNVFCQNNVLP